MTAALSQPLTCALLIDGVRVADGHPTDDPLSPTALSGLSVTWGRTTTVDQPAPASCTVDLWDRTGGAAYADLAAAGRRLDVQASTTIYPDPSVPTISDPGFAAGGPGRVADNGAVAVAGGVCTLRATDTARRGLVVFAPAAFAPEGAQPDAWDSIPKTAPGQSWKVGATVTVPVGAGATVYPATFTGPWASRAQVDTTRPIVVPADGAAHPVSLTYTPTPGGVWLGVAVAVWPPGPTWAQLPPTLTWAQVAPTLTWAGLATVSIDDLVVLAPPAGTTRTALVFSGRITDLSAEFAQTAGGGAVLVQITAQDHTSELANRDTGAEPWAVEALSARAQRIITASGQPTTITIDPGVAGLQVSRLDVDAQPTLGLLEDLATTCDGVLWSATHMVTGQYLRLEDTHARPALLMLAKVGGIVTIVPDPAPAAATRLSGCDVLLDPVRRVQDVADVATRVAVSWLEQTAPNTTEHTETVEDPGLISRLGVRRISIGTLLTSAADARAVAAAVLGRTSDTGWRLAGLTWWTGLEPLSPAQVSAAFTLLDGTTRLGAPLILADLPSWVDPSGDQVVPLFLEGGTATFTDGAWQLSMVTSSARGQGTGVTWGQLDPTWTWGQFDPTITWADLAAGVHA